MHEAGLVFLTSFTNADDFDLQQLDKYNNSRGLFIINVGDNNLTDTIPDVQIESNGGIEQAANIIFDKLVVNIK